jgi:predicted protein tyrosine phosphatase
MKTLTESIFELSAPFDNPYQGQAHRALFVCSAGLLRSPTGAAVAVKHGWNARSCGSHKEYALIQLNANLIYWAQRIYFVNPANLDRALSTFYTEEEISSELRAKSVVFDIEDDYEYMNPVLVAEFESLLFPTGNAFQNLV